MKILIGLLLLVNISVSAQDFKPLHPLPEFTLLDAQNSEFNSESLQGSYTILNFFFVGCQHICPIVNGKILTLYKEYLEDNLRFLSVSIDPELDGPEALSEYADRFGVQAPKWTFLHGDLNLINKLQEELMVHVSKDKNMHTTRLFLINPEGQVIKYYQGLDNDDFKLLQKDLNSILKK